MGAKWKDFLDRMKSGKRYPGKQQLLAVLLVGILLLVLAIPTGKKEELPFEEEEPSESAGTLEMYQEYLERRIANALEYVQGVGRAQVVITMKSSGEKVVEKDQVSDSRATSEEDSGGGTREIQERSFDKTSVYEQQSDGAQTPYVKKELTPEVEGVLVIADGGDDAVVVKDITEAIQALFGVEAHKIKIVKRTDT